MMKTKIEVGTFALLLFLASCKSDVDTVNTATKAPSDLSGNTSAQIDPTIKNNVPPSKLPIPDPCHLISQAEIKSIFKMNIDPTYNVGSEGENAERSCFFRVQDAKPNGAILIQVGTNPVPGEIDDYPVMIIQGKMQNGEENPETGKIEKYVSFPELGDMGCYNYPMARYHWQYNTDYLFMVAFNTTHTESQQKALALEIAKIINKNFLGTVNQK